jgi:hypothetical protein
MNAGRMKRLQEIFLISLLLVTPIFAWERRVEVRPSDRELIETKPQTSVTTVFRVTNIDTLEHEFISEVELPEDWKLITEDFPFLLGSLDSGSESDIKLVSFLVPKSTQPDVYHVTYRVKDRHYPSISDYYTVSISVLPIVDLDVSVLERPKFVVAGEDYQVSFLVTNESNITDEIGIAVKSDKNYPVTVDTETFTLGAGEKQSLCE